MDTNMGFEQATTAGLKVRVGLLGPDGSCILPALEIASQLSAIEGKKVAVLDLRNAQVRQYATRYHFVDKLLPDHNPENIAGWIKRVEASGQFGALIINDLSKAHDGTNGNLELVRERGNKYTAWQHVTPLHLKLVNAIAECRMHVIATLRTKRKYKQDNQKNVNFLGVLPIQREDMVDVFDIIGVFDKTRNELCIDRYGGCFDLESSVFRNDYGLFGQILTNWITPPSSLEQKEDDDVRLQALNRLTAFASHFGILEKHELRKVVKDAVGKDDPRFMSVADCEKVMRFIEETKGSGPRSAVR